MWNGTKKVVTLGNVTLELHYLGLNHGHGMTTFLIPKVKVGYIADIGRPNSILFAYLPDSNVDGLLAALENYAEFDVETIVFAHSGNDDTLMPGTMEDIRYNIQYIKVTLICSLTLNIFAHCKDLKAAVLTEIIKGGNPFTIPFTLQLPAYQNASFYNEMFPLNVQVYQNYAGGGDGETAQIGRQHILI